MVQSALGDYDRGGGISGTVIMSLMNLCSFGVHCGVGALFSACMKREMLHMA